MAQQYRVYGRTGLPRYGRIIDQEMHNTLKGTNGIRVYKEMRDNDPIIGAIILVTEMLCRGVEWEVSAGEDADQGSVEAAEFVASCIEDMSHTWPSFIGEIFGSMLPFGFAPFELCYKQRAGESKDPTRNSRYTDGRIGWRKLEIRSPETVTGWEFDDNNELKGMYQQDPTGGPEVLIPIEKLLLFRTKEMLGNPEGRSILRNAFRPWYFTKRIQEIEAIGIERDLAGLPVLEVPPHITLESASADEKAQYNDFKEQMGDVKRDEREGLVIPCEEISDSEGNVIKTGFKLRLLSTGGTRQFDTNAIITRYEQRTAMSALAEFLFLGMEKVGSFALASSKTNLFATATNAYLDHIAAQINRHAVPKLLIYNGMQPETMPEVTHGDLEQMPLEEIAKMITALSGAGAVLFPNEELTNAVFQRMGLPQIKEQADEL